MAERKYCDLCITIDDRSEARTQNYAVISTRKIYCHRSIVCPKSELIEMLVRRASDIEWPPVHDITMICPEHISSDDIARAIDILYNESNEDVIPIEALGYLLIDPHILLDLCEDLPCDRKLNEDEVCLIQRIYQSYGEDKLFIPLYAFYHWDVKSMNKEFVYTSKYKFGMESMDMVVSYDNYNKPECMVNGKSGKSGKVIDQAWFHFPSSSTEHLHTNEMVPFTAFGVDWVLHRFQKIFEIKIKIFVDEGFKDDHIAGKEGEYPTYNLRATLIVYSFDRKAYRLEAEQGDIDPMRFKESYMTEHKIPNHLIFKPHYRDMDSNQLRFSLFIERF